MSPKTKILLALLICSLFLGFFIFLSYKIWPTTPISPPPSPSKPSKPPNFVKTPKEIVYILTQNWGDFSPGKFNLPFFEILKADLNSKKILNSKRKEGYGKILKKGKNFILLKYKFPEKIKNLLLAAPDLKEKKKIFSQIKFPQDLESFICVYDKEFNEISAFETKVFDFEAKGDYLFAIEGKNLKILDLKDPQNPKELSILDFPNRLGGIFLKENKIYLFDKNDTFPKIYLLDIRDVLNPIVFSFEIPEKIKILSQFVSDKWYILEENSQKLKVLIFNLEPPIKKLKEINLKKAPLSNFVINNGYLYGVSLKKEFFVYNKMGENLASTTLEEFKEEKKFEVLPPLLLKNDNLYFGGKTGIFKISSFLEKQKIIETSFEVIDFFFEKKEKENFFVKGNLKILTDKKEYLQGEEIEITFKNNYNFPVFYSKKCNNLFWELEDCKGKKIFLGQKCKEKDSKPKLILKEKEILKEKWEGKITKGNKIKVLKVGCYRIVFPYFLKGEKEQRKAFSNEFFIKENKYFSNERYCEKDKDCVLTPEKTCKNKYNFLGKEFLQKDIECKCKNNLCEVFEKENVFLFLEKSNYKKGETIIVEIQNKSSKPIWWIYKRELPSLDLFYYQEEKKEWKKISLVENLSVGCCQGIQVAQLNPGKAFELSFEKWKDKFLPGKYKFAFTFTKIKPKNIPYFPYGISSEDKIQLKEPKVVYSQEFEIRDNFQPPLPR